MANSVYDAVVARAKQLYPAERVEAAVIEGISPLAKIALTARTARRALRLVSIPVQSARETVEAVVSAAEHAAAGQPLTEGEELAIRSAHDNSIQELPSCASTVFLFSARCLYLPEPLYGESIVLTRIALQTAIVGEKESYPESLLRDAFKTTEDDLKKLLHYAHEAGDPWIDPRLDRGWRERNDRGWRTLLEGAGIPFQLDDPNSPGELRNYWLRLHEALRLDRWSFYPPDLFSPP